MKILFNALLVLLPLLARAEDPTPDAVERRKTIIKTYDVTPNDALTIDNQFGAVSVSLWEKAEIRVQITIVANASSDDRTQAFLDAVTIDDKRSGNQIVVRTNFNQSPVSNWSLGSWKKGGDRNFVKINYEVMMPRQNALTLRNKFGNTSIPAFHAPLTVYSRYGNFSADDLTNRLTDLDIAYGKADIRTLDHAKMAVAYADLELARVNMLTLVNKFGKMRIAINFSMHLSHVETIGPWQRQGVDFCTTDDDRFLCAVDQTNLFRKRDRFIQCVHYFDAVGMKIFVAGDHDIRATGKRAAYRFPGFSAHDDRLAHRHSLEVFHVFRQMPGQRVVAADGAIV